jgi:hypothetical protein
VTKLTNTADLRINVRSEDWEHDGSPLFEGIYSVALNSTVDIAFVPDISDLGSPWSVALPVDVYNCQSEREARLHLLRTTDYSVTPNASRANQVEAIPLLPHPNPFPPLPDEPPLPEHGILWYISPEEWSALQAQLSDLFPDTRLEHEFVRLSQITGSPLGRFLEERFLPSGRLSASDLHVLRRD